MLYIVLVSSGDSGKELSHPIRVSLFSPTTSYFECGKCSLPIDSIYPESVVYWER